MLAGLKPQEPEGAARAVRAKSLKFILFKMTTAVCLDVSRSNECNNADN